MYGWRAKMGVLIPSGITAVEEDFKLMAPEGVAMHYNRYVFSGGKTDDEKGTMEDLKNAEKYIVEATEVLMHAHPSIIIMTGTGTSFVNGYGYDQKLIGMISQKCNGIPATTTSTAVIKALKALGVKRVSVAVPYLERPAKLAVEFVEAHGIEVVKAKWLGRAGKDIKVTTKEEIYQLVKSVDTPESEAIFVSCTDFNVLSLIDTLETDLRKPLVTSNQASMWDILRLVGIQDRISGFGQLLCQN